MTPNVTDNARQSRFELRVGAHTVFADYRRENETLSILHVEAPEALRGQGAAGALMKGIMEKAAADGFKVRPICAYAVAWLRKHPEYQNLLTE